MVGHNKAKKVNFLLKNLFFNQIPSESERRSFVNSKTEPGWTALMTAAENTQVEAARWLMKNGANVNSAMTTGWTAGHAAAKKVEVIMRITKSENQVSLRGKQQLPIGREGEAKLVFESKGLVL